MAYQGIDTQVQGLMDANRGNPQDLAKKYGVSKDLFQAMALMGLKKEEEAKANEAALKFGQQQQPTTEVDKLRQEIVDMRTQPMAQQVGGVAQQQEGQRQDNLKKMANAGIPGMPPQGIAGLPQAAGPRMAQGGIVGYANGGGVLKRNNNPIAMRSSSGNDWMGKIPGADEFENFEDPAYAYRAGARTLGTYGSKHKISTVRDAIHRWAPPHENDTENYVKFVASRMGVSPDAQIDLTDPQIQARAISAIAQMESGTGVSPEQVSEHIARVEGTPPAGRYGKAIEVAKDVAMTPIRGAANMAAAPFKGAFNMAAAPFKGLANMAKNGYDLAKAGLGALDDLAGDGGATDAQRERGSDIYGAGLREPTQTISGLATSPPPPRVPEYIDNQQYAPPSPPAPMPTRNIIGRPPAVQAQTQAAPAAPPAQQSPQDWLMRQAQQNRVRPEAPQQSPVPGWLAQQARGGAGQQPQQGIASLLQGLMPPAAAAPAPAPAQQSPQDWLMQQAKGAPPPQDPISSLQSFMPADGDIARGNSPDMSRRFGGAPITPEATEDVSIPGRRGRGVGRTTRPGNERRLDLLDQMQGTNRNVPAGEYERVTGPTVEAEEYLNAYMGQMGEEKKQTVPEWLAAQAQARAGQAPALGQAQGQAQGQAPAQSPAEKAYADLLARRTNSKENKYDQLAAFLRGGAGTYTAGETFAGQGNAMAAERERQDAGINALVQPQLERENTLQRQASNDNASVQVAIARAQAVAADRNMQISAEMSEAAAKYALSPDTNSEIARVERYILDEKPGEAQAAILRQGAIDAGIAAYLTAVGRGLGGGAASAPTPYDNPGSYVETTPQ